MKNCYVLMAKLSGEWQPAMVFESKIVAERKVASAKTRPDWVHNTEYKIEEVPLSSANWG
jgi:hypothetical protein